MKQWYKLKWILAPAAMLILLLDTKTAVSAVGDGIDMCLRSVIPSLFPFVAISPYVTQALSSRPMYILRPICRFCHMSEGSESLLLTGLLGGYPVGAQCIRHAYENGQLSSADAMRMVGFCNNAGPAFIFGVVGSLLANRTYVWVIWAIHAISALIVGMILPNVKTIDMYPRDSGFTKPFNMIDTAIKTIAKICSWILIFRTIIAYVDKYVIIFASEEASVVIAGLLELTNGCLATKNITDEPTRFLIISALLSFGGVCVSMQTLSVTNGINMSLYFPGKIMQCCISIIISEILLPILYSNSVIHIPLLFGSAFTLLLVNTIVKVLLTKKSIAILGNVRYNSEKSYI